jgi:hypothetical protein
MNMMKMEEDNRAYMADSWCPSDRAMPTSASADACCIQFALAADYWQSPPTFCPSELQFGGMPGGQAGDTIDGQERWLGSQASLSSFAGSESHGRTSRSDSGYSSAAEICTPSSYLSSSPLQSIYEAYAAQAHTSSLDFLIPPAAMNETACDQLSPMSTTVEALPPSTPATMFEIAKTSYVLEQGLTNDRLSIDARLSLTQSSLAQLQHVAGNCILTPTTGSLQLFSSAVMLLLQHYEHVAKELHTQQTTSSEDPPVIDPNLMHQPVRSHDLSSLLCLDPRPDQALYTNPGDQQSLACRTPFRLGRFELDAGERNKLIGRILRRHVRHCVDLCRVSIAEEAGLVRPSQFSQMSAYSGSLLADIQSFATRLEAELNQIDNM